MTLLRAQNAVWWRSAAVLLAALIAGGTIAGGNAAAQSTEAPDSYELDPISFRGPDPKQKFQDIKIVQKLGSEIPLDLEFVNEDGEQVKLGDYFGDKPVVLSLVFYECPALCTQILNGMVSSFDSAGIGLQMNEDYEVVTVSIDPEETPALARQKKEKYLERYHRDGSEEGWHFLVGDQEEIETLANAVGFRYFYDEKADLYAHASGIMIVTPGGKVSSYYLGTEYLPKKMKFGLMDAADGNIGSLVDQLVLLCYAYDPATGSYGFYVLGAVKLGAFATVGALLLFWGANYLASRKSRGRDSHGNQHEPATGPTA